MDASISTLSTGAALLAFAAATMAYFVIQFAISAFKLRAVPGGGYIPLVGHLWNPLAPQVMKFLSSMR